MYTLLFVINFFGLVSCAPSNDEILHLPGLNNIINFKHYSGFLDGHGADKLFYWFVESQNKPSKDPLVIWFNGGPGCSSLDGLLNELGPYHINQDGRSLFINKHSWNKIANVLFLESPTCVGFSYNQNGSSCTTNDDKVAETNYLAIKSFFKKFPEYRKNEFYIFGESYGGIYVPTLAELIIKKNWQLPFPLKGKTHSHGHVNLKGFAVGNGLSSYTLNDLSLLMFGYYHGLFGVELWKKIVDNCCEKGIPSMNTCDLSKLSCLSPSSTAMNIIFQNDLNMYNLYGKCLHPEDLDLNTTSRYHFDRHNLFLKMRTFLSEASLKESLLLANLKLDPPCTDSSYMRTYLDNPAVRKALHVPHNIPWDICNDDVNNNYQRTYKTMFSQYKFLTQHIRGLMYNGDVDMACNFLGDEWFSESLGNTVIAERDDWYFKDQIGGFVKRFNNLDVVTIRGAGHMVPQDKPGPAFVMFKTFLENNAWPKRN